MVSLFIMGWNYARETKFERKQRVQTFIVLTAPF